MEAAGSREEASGEAPRKVSGTVTGPKRRASRKVPKRASGTKYTARSKGAATDSTVIGTPDKALPYIESSAPKKNSFDLVTVKRSAPPPGSTVIGTPVRRMRMPGRFAGPVMKVGDSGFRVVLIFDSMRNPVERSDDPDWNERIYSGRNKTATYNTTVMVNHRGQIIWITPTVPGSTNDLTLLKNNLPDLGALTRLMLDPDTPPEKRPVVVADTGFTGLERILPGADVNIPIKRNAGSDPETGKLSQEDRDYNAEIAKVRIAAEHTIGEIKRYGIMSKPYRDMPERFNEELNMITGLVNLKRGWTT